ncbi:DUF4381 family protein [Lysobacter olei]
MSMNAPLVLRDVHMPAPPPWWPPAPGWWLVALAVLLAALALGWRRHARRRRHARIVALFDEAVPSAATSPQDVAVMSELLRRAARRHDARADRLEGEAWLALLNTGLARPEFDSPQGRLLLDGAFRPDVPAEDVAALRRIARMRFIAWMTAR